MSNLVVEGDYVIVQKSGGEHIRVMRLSKKQKVLIEKLKFDADSAFGHPYGLFEVVSGKVCPINPEKIVEQDGAGDIELRGDAAVPESLPSNGSCDTDMETNGNGSQLKAAQAGQKLTQDQVLDLKNKGTSAGELVAKLVEGNKSFTNRTVYSQSKYIRRKTKKHSDRVLILKPTIRMLAQAYYLKDAERVGNLRVDQLGLVIQMAGIHHGKNVVVFEQVLGLVTSSILERLGGVGSCIHLHRGAIAQSIPCVHSMNYDEQTLSTFLPVRITELLGMKRDGVVEETQTNTDNSAADGAAMETEDDISANLRRQDRLSREQKALDLLVSGVDSLVIAARTVDPLSVLETLYDKLRPCATIVVFGPNLKPLTDAQSWLMSRSCVNVQMSEQMYRIHQVLPDRTHPLMAQHVVGGVVLSAIKTLPQE